MRTGSSSATANHLEITYGSVHNYYEKMVFDRIFELSPRASADGHFFADVACVALNRLPPRYVRHDVDLTFFLSPIELKKIAQKVNSAVQDALDYVGQRADLPPLGEG